MSAAHLLDFHTTADADPVVIPLTGKTNGRDIFIALGAGAIPTLPSPWVQRVHWLPGAIDIDVWHLPAVSNTAAITDVSVDLNAARALHAVVWEDDMEAGSFVTGTPHENWPDTPTLGEWGSGVNTFGLHEMAFVVFYAQMGGTTPLPGTFDLTAYDSGFTEFGDSGVGGLTLSGRLWLASAPNKSESGGGVIATTSQARPVGWDSGGAIMFAYDQGAPPPSDPTLAHSPATLDFTALDGGDAPATQTISVTNAGTGGTVNFAVADDVAWLSVSPASGTAPQVLTVSVDQTSLEPGIYDATITITAVGIAGSPQTVAVSLIVAAVPPVQVTPKVGRTHRRRLAGWQRVMFSGEADCAYQTPEANGAKRDCRGVEGINIASGDDVVELPGANLSILNVDQKVVIYGAGFVSDDRVMVATITDVVDATHAVLSANAQFTVVGGRGAFGTDDQDAWNAAIQEVVAKAMADKTSFARVQASAGQYLCAKPPIQNGVAKGFAQIELPAINPLVDKVTLELLGVGNPMGWLHWASRVPAVSGTVIRTAMGGADSDGAWGVPSVIGGPASNLDWNIAGDASTQFSNMLIRIDGIKVVTPPNPSMIAVDLQHIAHMDMGKLLCQVDSVVDYYGPGGSSTTPIGHADFPTNTQNMGLRCPAFGNNALNRIEEFGCQGFYYGISPTDHFHIDRLGLIYCDTGIVIVHFAGAAEHTMSFNAVNIEATQTLIEVIGGGGKVPIVITDLHTETGGGDIHIKDPSDNLYGEIGWAHNSSSKPTVTGSKNLRISDRNQPRGLVPAAPDATHLVGRPVFGTTAGTIRTGVPFLNPFWRDCWVYVTGGTVTKIEVDGIDTHVTTGPVFVPTGKEITVTYSVAPTAEWNVV